MIPHHGFSRKVMSPKKESTCQCSITVTGGKTVSPDHLPFSLPISNGETITDQVQLYSHAAGRLAQQRPHHMTPARWPSDKWMCMRERRFAAQESRDVNEEKKTARERERANVCVCVLKTER